MTHPFKKQLYISLAFIVGVLGFATLYQGAVKADSGKCKTGSSTTSSSDCYKTNYQIAQKAAQAAGGGLSAGDFQKAVQDCTNAGFFSGGVLSGGTVILGNNDTAGCSNAVASCMSQESDFKACLDPTVTAPATNCSTNGNTVGDIGPGNNGTSGCGWNYIIDKTDKYKSNGQINNENVSNAKDAACKTEASGNDAGALEACQKKVENDLNDCYNQQGGMNANINQTTLNQCLASKAQNDEQCKAYAGSDATFNNGKCTLPPPPTPTPPPKCKDGSTADANGNCPDGSNVNNAEGPTSQLPTPAANGQCGEAKTNLISCDKNARGGEVLGTVLKFGVQALTVLVGVGAVGGIAWEALQYARAQDNQSIVSKARERIRDIVIGLVVYGFMIAIINWLVPGGVIK